MKRGPRLLFKRADEWARGSPVLVTLFLLALVISSVLTITNAANDLWEGYARRYHWKNAEYTKLESLRAGFTAAKFNEVLGSPTFITVGYQDATIREALYQGRDYWVQAIIDERETVIAFSVTACAGFHPAFKTPLGTVTLGESSFELADRYPSQVYYFISGATATSYLLEEYGEGNPGHYKTFYFGITEACGRLIGMSGSVEAMYQAGYFFGRDWPDREFPLEDPILAEFRRTSTINTFGETAPGISPARFLTNFNIGANRMLTRTLE